MNIGDILVSVLLTMIAGATISYISIHLKEEMDRRKMFKALYFEITSNHEIANAYAEGYDYGMYSNFKNLAFQRIMMSGRLYDLPSDIFSPLAMAYFYIECFNEKRFFMDSREMCKAIEEGLSYLKKELPKNLRVLSIRN